MSIEKQYEFVRRQLAECAAYVGINLEESHFGLMAIHDRSANLGAIFEPEDEIEANRLLEKFGETSVSLELLCALGEACLFSDGFTFSSREWEKSELWLQPGKPMDDDDLQSAGWENLEQRALCDFAMYVGRVMVVVEAYAHENAQTKGMFSRLGTKGATVRHAPNRKLKDWAVQRYRGGKWASANDAAHDLKNDIVAHGRTIGANLSEKNAQRTIAEWFRKAEKSG